MSSRLGGHIHWDLSFVRRLNDWEEESVCNLLAILASREVRTRLKMSWFGLLMLKGHLILRAF